MATKAVELQVGERAVRVSSPDKVYFPELGLTKLDVINYYLAVGDGMLAALRDRPTTMERWPGGVREGMRLAVGCLRPRIEALEQAARRGCAVSDRHAQQGLKC